MILAAMAALAIYEWQQSKLARRAVLTNFAIRDSEEKLLAHLVDAESGQRGFLLTGDEQYLQPYHRALQTIPNDLSKLRNAVAALDHADDSNLERLNELTAQKLSELRTTIDLRKTQGIEPAMTEMRTDRGKRAMDEIREISATILSRAAAAQDRMQAKAGVAARDALVVSVIGSAFLVGLLILWYGAITSAIKERELALSQARTARDSLKTTLASIGDAVISTDSEGRVVTANRVAQSLIRAPESELVGRSLYDVFDIRNESTGEKVESPVSKVLREGTVAGLANHTVLVAQDGTQIPIDDTAAPIRSEDSADGSILGTVLVFRDVTERRHAEAANQLLSSIVESSQDAIISKDLKGIVTSWNRGAERIFGYTAEEMIGQPVSRIATPDKEDEIPEILARVALGERIEHFQTTRMTKAGEIIDVSITVSPVRDATGRITGASKVARDITADVKAQALVEEHRERLRVTLGSIGDAVIATDAAGCISYLNPVAEELTGWKLSAAMDKPLEAVFRIVNEESREVQESPVARVLRERRAVGLANHTVMIKRGGGEVAIDDSAAPILDSRGDLVGVVLVFRDIGERRERERLLAKQAEELRQRSYLLERIPCFVRDLDSQITSWTNGAADLYGYSEQQAIGRVSHELLQTIFPMSLAEIDEQLMDTGEWHGDLIHTRSDGTKLIVASYWALDRDAEGNPLSVLEINSDITGQKRAEEQRQELIAKDQALASERALRELQAELARVARVVSVGELATSIAHEINQPLAGVVTNAEAGMRWLSAASPNIEEAQKSLALIARDGNRASSVIRRVRAFLKKEELHTSITLSEVVQETIALTSSELAKRGIKLHTDFDADLPRVQGDRVQLQQVVLNLTMNAVDAMASSDPPKELRISLKRSGGDAVLLSVSDSGPGISEEQLPRMFEPFFTTKPSGMGIGLSISRSIIEAHRGRIWADRRPGRGLTVSFALPAERNGHDSFSNQPSTFEAAPAISEIADKVH